MGFIWLDYTCNEAWPECDKATVIIEHAVNKSCLKEENEEIYIYLIVKSRIVTSRTNEHMEQTQYNTYELVAHYLVAEKTRIKQTHGKTVDVLQPVTSRTF